MKKFLNDCTPSPKQGISLLIEDRKPPSKTSPPPEITEKSTTNDEPTVLLPPLNLASSQQTCEPTEGGISAGTADATIQLNKFDMSVIKPNAVVAFIGKRNTGKSTLLMDYLFHQRNIPVISAISPTEDGNATFGKVLPPILIHKEYSETLVEKILDRQRKVKKHYMKQKDESVPTDKLVDPRSILIMDDCMYNNDWVRHKPIRELFFNGRHWELGFVFTMQYPVGIPPVLRSNIDYIFLLRENIKDNRDKLYKFYAGMFGSAEVFSQVLDQTTENFGCLVINNTTKSNQLIDQAFWYKADQHEPYHTCSERYWKLSKEISEKKEGATTDLFSPCDQRKRNGTKLRVLLVEGGNKKGKTS